MLSFVRLLWSSSPSFLRSPFLYNHQNKSNHLSNAPLYFYAYEQFSSQWKWTDCEVNRFRSFWKPLSKNHCVCGIQSGFLSCAMLKQLLLVTDYSHDFRDHSISILLNTKDTMTSRKINHTMDVNGVHPLFSYQHSSEYLPLCLTKERNTYRFETT